MKPLQQVSKKLDTSPKLPQNTANKVKKTSTQKTSHLHPITNTQKRHLPLPNNIPNSLSNMRCTLLIHTVGSTTQNHRSQFMLAKFFGCDETRVEFTVDVKFTDTTGDEVGVLGAKVEDGNLGTGEVVELGGLFEVFWLF